MNPQVKGPADNVTVTPGHLEFRGFEFITGDFLLFLNDGCFLGWYRSESGTQSGGFWKRPASFSRETTENGSSQGSGEASRFVDEQQ